MMPIAPLMLEHRLMERMVRSVKGEMTRIKEKEEVRIVTVDLILDFLKTYVEQCHHGKEEGILFPLLSERTITDEDQRTMTELKNDHVRIKTIAEELFIARENYQRDERGARVHLISTMEHMAAFIPEHIMKEDRHFFIPSMNYFTPHEQDDIFEAFAEFDRKVIHDRYRWVVETIEGRRPVAPDGHREGSWQ
jgi:hemerythrin-like domain-containing protein